MTPEFIEALLEGDRERAGQELDVELPDGFPRDGGMRFFKLRLRQMRKDAALPRVVSARRRARGDDDRPRRLSRPARA